MGFLAFSNIYIKVLKEREREKTKLADKYTEYLKEELKVHLHEIFYFCFHKKPPPGPMIQTLNLFKI